MRNPPDNSGNAGAAGSGVALRQLDLLGTNPFITGAQGRGSAWRRLQHRRAALRRLVQLRIVKQIGEDRRDRVFCAQALLDILEEPPRLRPA
ncbi:MAG: hypothetical protein WCF18_15275 [Chthoniobacteraceae bacterium]